MNSSLIAYIHYSIYRKMVNLLLPFSLHITRYNTPLSLLPRVKWSTDTAALVVIGSIGISITETPDVDISNKIFSSAIIYKENMDCMEPYVRLTQVIIACKMNSTRHLGRYNKTYINFHVLPEISICLYPYCIREKMNFVWVYECL